MRVPVAVFRGFDSADAIRAIRRLRAEGERGWTVVACQAARRS